jgi:hypothetical protein
MGGQIPYSYRYIIIENKPKVKRFFSSRAFFCLFIGAIKKEAAKLRRKSDLASPIKAHFRFLFFRKNQFIL